MPTGRPAQTVAMLREMVRKRLDIAIGLKIISVSERSRGNKQALSPELFNSFGASRCEMG